MNPLNLECIEDYYYVLKMSNEDEDLGINENDLLNMVADYSKENLFKEQLFKLRQLLQLAEYIKENLCQTKTN